MIGETVIYTYRVMCVLASLSIPLVILFRRKYYGMNSWQTLLFSFSAILSGFAGCNVLYGLENMGEVFRNGWSFTSFSFFGSILFTPLVLMLFALILKIPMGNALDLLALGLPPFLAIVRIGCFCGGCCGGITYFFANGGQFTVPTQLIESCLDVLIFLFLLRLENKHLCCGYHFPIFLVLYGALRFSLEFFRDTPKNLLVFSNGQIYSILVFLIGGTVLLLSRNKMIGDYRQWRAAELEREKAERRAKHNARVRYKKNH